MSKRRNKLANQFTTPQKVVSAIILILTFIIMAIPLWNTIIVSTSSTLSATEGGIKLWWDDFSFEGYSYVIKVSKLLQPFLNSLYVTSVGVIVQVILSAFAGYVLIQKELPFKGAITSFVMLTMMIPGDLTLISVYLMNKQLNLLNSYMGLIVNGLISGFSILLMRNYFTSVPYSLSESARIDGASELHIFAKIYLPVSKPGLATVFFVEYVAKWNTIMLPATLITDQDKYTLPLMLKAMIMQDDSTSGAALAPDNAVMAAIVISTIPLLLIYIFAQRFLLAGMNLGATKE